jgi:hypothetical protein
VPRSRRWTARAQGNERQPPNVEASRLLAIALVSQGTTRAQDPLPSWNDGLTKQAILD